MFASLVLGFAVLMLAGFGTAFLLLPDRMAALVDLKAGSTSARSDIRAVYGGLEIGLAVFLFWCLLEPELTGIGLALTAAIFGFTAAGRGIGMLLDRPVTGLTVKVFALEAIIAILAVVAG